MPPALLGGPCRPAGGSLAPYDHDELLPGLHEAVGRAYLPIYALRRLERGDRASEVDLTLEELLLLRLEIRHLFGAPLVASIGIPDAVRDEPDEGEEEHDEVARPERPPPLPLFLEFTHG